MFLNWFLPFVLWTPFRILKFLMSFGCIFFVDYVLRIYSTMAENPQYKGLIGRFTYVLNKILASWWFFVSCPPFWIDIVFFYSNAYLFYGQLNNVCYCQIPSPSTVRILRFEKYTKAFTILDDISRDNVYVLGVTGGNSLQFCVTVNPFLGHPLLCRYRTG